MSLKKILHRLVESESGQCEISVLRPGSILNMRRAIRSYDSGSCTRKAVKTIMWHPTSKKLRVCAQHERMAEDGFVDQGGNVMDPRDRSNYQSGKVRWAPPDKGNWVPYDPKKDEPLPGAGL